MIELINEFITCTTAERMCVVRTRGGVSVMPLEDYKLLWGRYHQHKWNGKQNTKHNKRKSA